jgi:hypothetical protein
MRQFGISLAVAALLTCGHALAAGAPEIRPGVWAAQQAAALPLPTAGFQVYLAGEFHGLKENVDFQLQYLELLHRASGLRDVAIEERGAFEADAQAYVDGRSGALPPALCLRASLLEGIRRLNAGLKEDARIRVHLTDVDTSASAIRRHLVALQQRLGANGLAVALPEEAAIKEHGLEAVAQLKPLAQDPATRGELRTVELSIISLQQGLEADVGQFKGSPYLESREDAVAGNIIDLVRLRATPSLLAVYGDDHVSGAPVRNFAGPQRDQLYTPLALRLERAGIKAFSLMTLPLAGQAFWRGRRSEVVWTAADANLASGETLDKVLATAPDAAYLYIDPKRERAHMPGEDLNRMTVDALLLFRTGTPAPDRCASR